MPSGLVHKIWSDISFGYLEEKNLSAISNVLLVSAL